MIEIDQNTIWDNTKLLSEQTEESKAWFSTKFIIQNHISDNLDRIIHEIYEDSEFKIETTYTYQANTFLLATNEPSINIIRK